MSWLSFFYSGNFTDKKRLLIGSFTSPAQCRHLRIIKWLHIRRSSSSRRPWGILALGLTLDDDTNHGSSQSRPNWKGNTKWNTTLNIVTTAPSVYRKILLTMATEILITDKVFRNVSSSGLLLRGRPCPAPTHLIPINASLSYGLQQLV